MSVLYKALQKAQAENEQKQGSGQALDAERLAGSGAIRAAGRGGLNWRLGAIIAVAVMAIAIVGSLFLFEDSAPVQTASAPRTQPTPPAPAPAPAAQMPAAPEQPALQPPPPAQPDATAPTQVASQVSPAPVAATPAPVDSAPAPAAPAESAPAATPPPPTTVAANTPTPLTPQTTSSASAAEKPAEKPAEKAPAAPQQIPTDSPARVLSPPISIRRADYEFAGVGDVVQVRQVSQQAQDNVGAGYNALVRGDYDMALGFYDRALKQEPRSIMAQLGLAASHHKLGRIDEARAAYEKVLKNDPNNREALTNLTAIMADKAPAEALTRLQELEREYPNFSPIKAQIGLIHAKNDQLDPALEYLRRAVSLTPDAVLYRYNLALVLDRLGRKDQAVAAYRQTLDSEQEGVSPRECPRPSSRTDCGSCRLNKRRGFRPCRTLPILGSRNIPSP